jgi:LmbE family N-acetylglucosaminyl deacetylase
MMKKRILVVAPHPDDETLGAGGAIAKFSEQGHQVSVLVVSGHLPPIYSRENYEITVSEAKSAFKILGVAESRFLEIPATMVSEQPVGVLNGKIAGVIREVEPHIVLCPFPDRHIDHRVVFESVMVATRPVAAGRCIELLAAYETLSETHWNAAHIEPNFVPNWIMDITMQINRKIDAVGCYKSQIPAFPDARSIEAVNALAKFRGTQAGFAYGESFQIIRMIG